jgi:O-antigen/teichoic acid export membrane protein
VSAEFADVSVTPEGPDQAMARVADGLRKQAVRGGATLLARGTMVRIIGLAATLALARLITPHDIGLAALGTTALIVGGLLADGGVGVGLLRRTDPPSADELSALLGFQLAIAVLLSLIALTVGSVTGPIGLVAAAMLAGLPFYAIRAPTTILCERELDYGPVAAAEIAEAAVFAVVAAALAIAGLGVWAIVLGSLARAAAGTVVLLVRAPHALVRPSLRLGPVRPLLAFGFQFQSAGLISLIRDEGLNILVAVLGGVAELGVWSLGRRFAQVAFVLFESLWRVSYPVFSRLVEAGADLRQEIERGLRLSGAGTGLALVGITASAPSLVPALVGPGWSGVPAVIAAACAGLAISGPVSATLSGYLYAVGAVRAVVNSLVITAAIWLGLAAALLPSMGVLGVALAWTIACWCEVALLVRATRASVREMSLVGLRPALVAGLVAVPPFWYVAHVNSGIVAGVLVAVGATAAYVLLLCVMDRSLVPSLHRYWRGART